MAKRRSATEKNVKQQNTQSARNDSGAEFTSRNEIADGNHIDQHGTDKKENASRNPPLMSEVEFNARVARKAFELFERRGSDSGRDVEDWLEAERMVKEEVGNESQL